MLDVLTVNYLIDFRLYVVCQYAVAVNKVLYIGFKVLTAVATKTPILWD
jgi:hypothetical protein